MELMASQVSSESLRRLALSPRKPKRTLDLGLHGSPGSKPVLTFSEKLTAEMSRAAPGDQHTFGGGSSCNSPLKPKKLKFEAKTPKAVVNEDIEVQGSDSGSDADWDDKDVYVSAASTPQNIPMESEPAIDLSDDDIPTLSKFTSKKGPIELDDSDSDFGEDPFAGMNSASVISTPPAATSTPTTPPRSIVVPASAPRDDVFDSDIELSEGEDSDTDAGTSGSNGRRTRSVARPAARSAPATTSRYGRALRNTNPKPEPDFDIPVRRASKCSKSAKEPLFSLDSLLKEKERRERVGYDLQVIKNHIALDDEQLEEFDMKEEELQAIPEGILSEEQEAALKVIIKDSHTQTVEDIAEFFIHWPQNLVVESLDFHLTDADRVDHIVQRVLKHTQTEVQRHQFLTSPFLPILCSSPWTMPRSLFRWLVHVVATEHNQSVTLSVFSIIQKVLSQRTSLLGVDHQDLVRIFCIYGAKEEYLDEEWQVTPVTGDTMPERAIGMRNISLFQCARS
ncbi:MAG: hypothetical protein J3R72DRAFT_163323 [Linnemannia gamsii]|nr:MAG: hypothetical protein J3R72DRAFT_163323 [Linnemannia gamsii]